MKTRHRVETIPYRLAFREPLVTAAGTWTDRQGFWLRLKDEEGRIGLGEVAPLPGFSTETIEEAGKALLALSGPRSISDDLLTAPPAVRAGLDLALLDLEAQDAGCPLAGLFARAPRKRITVNALIRGLDPISAADEAAGAVALGYRTLKLKVGIGTPDQDARRIAAVRERVGSGVRLRADANGAWDVATAIHALTLFEPFGLEYVEQPVIRDLAPIRRHARIAIAADESVVSPAAARALIRERSVNFLILKPMAIGGVRVAWGIVEEARRAAMGVVVTSILDTAVGVAAALHLAAALPGAEIACGLATLALFESMPVEGLGAPERGAMALPEEPGLGVRLIEGGA